jgi:hypothetical protein
MSPVRYELGFYVPVDGILHSHCRENLRSYTACLVRIQQTKHWPKYKGVAFLCLVKYRLEINEHDKFLI